MSDRPAWWDWSLEIGDHRERRMPRRGITGLDVRVMVEDEDGMRSDMRPGRRILETSLRERRWQVVTEPDPVVSSTVAITAARVGTP